MSSSPNGTGGMPSSTSAPMPSDVPVAAATSLTGGFVGAAAAAVVMAFCVM